MSWVKKDDMFSLHRKIRPLSDAAYRLHDSGLCFASRNTTNGHILAADLSQVSDVKNPKKVVKELEAQGLWEPTEIGWEIHDYLEYNPSADEVQAAREAAKERQRKWRGNKKSQRDSTVTDDVTTQNETREFANPLPVPDPRSSSGSVSDETPPPLPAQREPGSATDAWAQLDSQRDWKDTLRDELERFYGCDYPMSWVNRTVEMVIGSREVDAPISYVMAAVRNDRAKYGPTVQPRSNPLAGLTVGRSL